jgi:hypothetical protein
VGENIMEMEISILLEEIKGLVENKNINDAISIALFLSKKNSEFCVFFYCLSI